MAQLKFLMPPAPVLLIQSPSKRIRGLCCLCASSSANPDLLVHRRDAGDQKQQKSTTIAGVDQNLLLDPWLLADSNSRFAEYNGVQVHYKIAAHESSAEAGRGIPAILLHGFGASVFSWERLLQPLSQVLAAAAVAFDRPGFGLTSRIIPSVARENPYALEFSASIAVAFMDFLKADRAILIGHSAGCIVAADAYFKAPERVAALVLIAPAIAAPLMIKQREKKDVSSTKKQPASEEESQSSQQAFKFIGALFMRLRFVLLDIFSRLVNFIEKLREVIVALYCKLITAVLRSRLAIWVVRLIMDKYGEKVVRLAWYNPEKADKTVIRGYTKPLGCRNWDRALLEYVIALVAKRDKEQKLIDKLPNITCPVLVITGDTDRLVPAWNAERLARLFRHSSFHLIKQCGHLPHEEKPEEVMRIIKDFVRHQAGVS